ncbi:trypco2 family protein [Streptomyces sp. NPDC054770]
MIELYDMIRELRRQLIAAAVDGDGQTVRFELGPIEVEATVAVTREAGAGAKVRVWVVDLDSNGRYAQAQTQRVKLTLIPKAAPAGGGSPQPAMIAGVEVDGER